MLRICHSVLYYKLGARGSVVGWGTMLHAGRLRVRFPTRSLDISIYLILEATHHIPGVNSASNKNVTSQNTDLSSLDTLYVYTHTHLHTYMHTLVIHIAEKDASNWVLRPSANSSCSNTHRSLPSLCIRSGERSLLHISSPPCKGNEKVFRSLIRLWNMKDMPSVGINFDL
jgi:hypothetical protein